MKKELKGQKFNRLTVVEWDKEKSKWACKCDCGNPNKVYVASNKLTTGHTKSCGCLNIEAARERAIKRNKENIVLCDYEVQEYYVIMYTSKGETFTIDLEDFWRIKDWYCSIDKKGYVVCEKEGKRIKLHRLIMNAPKGLVVDHKNHDKSNNCKSNLRLATNAENSRNKKASKNNISGYAGVIYIKTSQKWRAFITVDKKNIILGLYENIQDAIKARIEAEDKYYGEFGYHNSMRDINGEVHYGQN